MPFHLTVHSDGIYCCNEKTDSEELVSNFTISLNRLVEVAKEAGGPGYLATIKCFPDEAEKYFYSLSCSTTYVIVLFWLFVYLFNIMHTILK